MILIYVIIYNMALSYGFKTIHREFSRCKAVEFLFLLILKSILSSQSKKANK